MIILETVVVIFIVVKKICVFFVGDYFSLEMVWGERINGRVYYYFWL